MGAGIAGLLAARVLSEHVDDVLVMDRDVLPEASDARPRRIAPSARLADGLLARGRQAIEELLPGFTDSLIAQGAVAVGLGVDAAWQGPGAPGRPLSMGGFGLCVSRTLIEAEIRRRVQALPGVQLCGDIELQRPVFAHGRVAGVEFNSRPAECTIREPLRLDADLVVDCSGRGSRCPQWLRLWGYEPPQEEHMAAHSGPTAASDRWVAADRSLTASPMQTDGPGLAWPVAWRDPGDRRESPVHDHPADGPTPHAARPTSQRRRYEQLRRFPAGLLVMGEALASLNPAHGQGMTVTASQALALRDWLTDNPDLSRAPSRAFFRDAARAADAAWRLAVCGDLDGTGFHGPQGLGMRLSRAYVRRLRRAAQRDASITAAFARVVHLLAPPATLARPRMLWRVWRLGGAGSRWAVWRPSAPAADAGPMLT